MSRRLCREDYVEKTMSRRLCREDYVEKTMSRRLCKRGKSEKTMSKVERKESSVSSMEGKSGEAMDEEGVVLTSLGGVAM
jgi:hypothetical protein